jgi:hypothetical protein
MVDGGEERGAMVLDIDGQRRTDTHLPRMRKKRCSGSRFSPKLAGRLAVLMVLAVSLETCRVEAWQWSDFSAWTMGGGGEGSSAPSPPSDSTGGRTFTFAEVSAMRVRDLKWHLARRHGFGADEIGRMIDKKDLIEALAIEEEKARIKAGRHRKRRRVQSSVLWSLAAVAAAICWPLIRQAIDIVHVNAVVYYDRKCYEVGVCREHRSLLAAAGFMCMFAIDALQLWLSISITLSWFVRRRWWFFPTPNLPVRPGQFMGEEVAKSQAGNYGINVGPMVLTWLMRYVHSKIESWTGRALVRAQREHRKRQRDAETSQERAARKEAKRVAKEHEAEQQALWEAAAAAASAAEARSATARTDPHHNSLSRPAATLDRVESEHAPLHQQMPRADVAPTRIPISAAHEEFLSQLEEMSSPLDELD